tara:strand:+ start:154 stop:729 length:576 start_codon:yes stop_codon:yes gene_type:complete
MNDYIVIDKPENKPYIIIENLNQLPKVWFYNYIFGWNKIFYVYSDDIKFKLNDLQKIKIQFEKDVTRMNFKINKIKFKNYDKILSLIQNHEHSKLFMFLCSQSSLAFLIENMLFSLQEKDTDLLIAEMRNEKDKVMTINLNLDNNTVSIKKKLRVVKNCVQLDRFIEIQEFELNFLFQIKKNKIKCLISIY